MIDLAKIDFNQNIDILSITSEVELVDLGDSLVHQASNTADIWLRSRARYLAARAFRDAEARRVRGGGAGSGYGDKVISNLETASADEHLISMLWLHTCYTDGQKIVEPAPEKSVRPRIGNTVI